MNNYTPEDIISTNVFVEHCIDDYFEWLCSFISNNRMNKNVSYNKLFKTLFETDFKYSIDLDVNRAADGIDLRRRYELDTNIDIRKLFKGKACSILEMFVALADRCEESIMSDTRYGDRTAQWFWTMIDNLGINFTDDTYNEKEVNEKLRIFMKREYSKEGKGNIFYLPGCLDDLREVDIWTQLCWFLDNFS